MGGRDNAYRLIGVEYGSAKSLPSMLLTKIVTGHYGFPIRFSDPLRADPQEVVIGHYRVTFWVLLTFLETRRLQRFCVILSVIPSSIPTQ